MRARVRTTPTAKKSSERLEQLGTAAFLMTRCRYQSFAAACLKVWLEPAIDFQQIRFFYDNKGKPVGYVTWAWLAPDVSARLVADGSFMMHLSEWTEGEELWILDFVAPFGHALDIAAECARLPELSAAREVRFARRRPDGSIRKVGRLRNPGYRPQVPSPDACDRSSR